MEFNDSFWIVNSINGGFSNKKEVFTALFLSEKDTVAYFKTSSTQIKKYTQNELESFYRIIDYIKFKKELPTIFDAYKFTFIMKIKLIKNRIEVTGENLYNFKKVNKF